MQSICSSKWLLFLIIICSLQQLIHCGGGVPGTFTPSRIELEINGSANITCIRNPATLGRDTDSSSLYFVEEISGRVVPQSNVKIVNETTAVFMIQNAEKQDLKYICKEKNTAIGITHVIVGTPPQSVTDFKCRGYDYVYLVCTFTTPNNVVPTKYNLIYTAHQPCYTDTRAGKRVCNSNINYSQNYHQLCDLKFQDNQSICNLTFPNYRANYEIFTFNLTASNVLGENKQGFVINNYESVVPPIPEYSFKRITNDSVLLKWHNSRFSYYTNKGFNYDLKIKPHNFDFLDSVDYRATHTREEYSIQIKNLPYAHFKYNVSLRLRVNQSNAANNDDDSLWSMPYNQQFQTEACLPESAPRTDIGSFYIDPTETKLRLYWHQLPYYKHNGPNFEYVIKEVLLDDKKISLKPLNIGRSFAVFNWSKQHSYKFTIVSRNAKGESPNNSTIFVPNWSKHRNHSAFEPTWIRNIGNNSHFTALWTAPKKHHLLKDYTVFWCHQKPSSSDECSDNLNFQHVAKNITEFSKTSWQNDLNLIFAVSANYLEFNTGMHWNMCPAKLTDTLPKLVPTALSTTSRNITIQWDLNMVCLSNVEGYKINYCRLAQDQNCRPDSLITLNIPSTDKKYTIPDLQPFSSYIIDISMYSKYDNGTRSEQKIFHTQEEAPSQPTNLIVSNVTSNSAMLSWSPPEHLNGKLRKYIIDYNGEPQIIDCEDPKVNCKSETIQHKLENLSSFTRYKIFVRAFTTAASLPSNDVHLLTLIGVPSKPRYINNDPEKSPDILEWSPPEVPSGRIEFYEVAITVWYNNEKRGEHISTVVNATACKFRLPVCIDGDYRYTIQVRAVNAAERNSEIDHLTFAANPNSSQIEEFTQSDGFYADNTELACLAKQSESLALYQDSRKYVLYKSVWEKGPTTNCQNTKISRITMLALLVVVSSLGVMAAFYVARNKYKKMSNIACSLPPGVQAIVLSSKEAKDGSDFRHNKDYFFSNENRRLLSTISQDSGNPTNTAHSLPAGVEGIVFAAGKANGNANFPHNKHCFYSNENRRLLSSISQDSGFDCHNPACGANLGSAEQLAKPKLEYCTLETLVAEGANSSRNSISSHCLSDVIPPPAVTNEGYMVMKSMPSSSSSGLTAASSASSSQFHQLIDINNKQSVGNNDGGLAAIAADKFGAQLPTASFLPTDNNGYITQLPSVLSNPQLLPATDDSGYVKPNNIISWAESANNQPSSGYVQSQMLQKPALPSEQTTNGYTTLDALSKNHLQNTTTTATTNLPSTEAVDSAYINMNRRQADVGGLPPISGYVTQKELSAFGQHQQQQQQQQTPQYK